MTGALELFLRRINRNLATKPSTVPGIGPGGWDSKALANAQGSHFDYVTPSAGKVKTVYRLYTEDVSRVRTRAIVARYFEGATLTYGVGLDTRTQDTDEESLTIEIVTSKADAFQRVLDLAGDIRETNAQVSVLITRHTVTTFEVTERTPSHGEL